MKKKSVILLLLIVQTFCCSLYAQPKLNSFPTATATIYLDFDGEIVNSIMWNGGNTLNCLAAPLSAIQMRDVFDRVSEDYRPFQINITTDNAVFLAAPIEKRIRVIITPTSSWYTPVGGVAFVGSFTWGDDTPCFVFTNHLGNLPKNIAECCSHESGHSLGLYHQAIYDTGCNLIASLNLGTGSGENGWAPIMGNSYNRNMSVWNNGSTSFDCIFLQDNLFAISSYNGFTYREDDFSDSLNVPLSVIDYNDFYISGIIGTTDDNDAFKIGLSTNTFFHLEIKPFSVGEKSEGANLDIKAKLYDASKTLIRTYDPSTMNVVIDTFLTTGNYYLIVSGTGNINTGNYGSLGSYIINRSGAVILPIRGVTLNGKVDKGKHDLSWKIIADEPIKSIELEMSNDGINFIANKILSASINAYVYIPPIEHDIYYRLKVISLYGQIFYSDVIILKTSHKNVKPFILSGLFQQGITINASVNYTYNLIDHNGRVLVKGLGVKGLNKLNFNKFSKGLYILQLMNNSIRQTERILL